MRPLRLSDRWRSRPAPYRRGRRGFWARLRRLFGFLVTILLLVLVSRLLPDGYVPSSETPMVPTTNPFPCTVAGISDGDTLRCAEQAVDGRTLRIRLSGIAARERDGRCLPGHPCPAAPAEAATAALTRLAGGQALTCRHVGDANGRVAAFCRRRDGVDLSCAMVASGTALRWESKWGGHRC